MRLVDRYVHDVVRRLPESQREDVAKELSAEIQEMIDDRSNGKNTSNKDVTDVLTDLGHPRHLADQYRERPRYVIGPEYYELYVNLLKTILVIVLPLLIFVVWMSEAMTVQHSVLSILLKLAGVAFEAAVHIFFWTTLSFALVQHFMGDQKIDGEWKPEDLPELPPEQEIGRGESYFAISWFVFAVLATLFQVPFIYSLLGPDDVPQFFAPEMWPWWTLGLLGVSLLGLIAELVKLAIGGWTKLTVGLITFTNLVAIVFFVSVVQLVQPIANPAMMALLDQNIAGSVEVGIKIFVAVVVILSLWEIGEAVYKLNKGVKK